MQTFNQYLTKNEAKEAEKQIETMNYYMVIAYDRVNETDEAILQKVMNVLVNAEAQNMRPVLNTTIEFSLEVQHGEQELFWILNEICEQTRQFAYIKIYVYTFPKGEGKIFSLNKSSKEDNKYIGISFQEAKLNALAAKKSFRSQFPVK